MSNIKDNKTSSLDLLSSLGEPLTKNLIDNDHVYVVTAETESKLISFYVHTQELCLKLVSAVARYGIHCRYDIYRNKILKTDDDIVTLLKELAPLTLALAEKPNKSKNQLN